MQNTQLSERTARDIDSQVEKVLRGLGNPEPPLQLAEVRALLELDLKYYSSSQTGVLADTANCIRVGIRQVFRRPTLLIDAVRKLSLKALWVPDRKRVLIDQDEPKLKHRWTEAHEVGHSIIEWHKEYLHGDNQRTLLPLAHELIEAEANYAAGRLLFLRDRFEAELYGSTRIDFSVVQSLYKAFGNTMTTTLWRTVEHIKGPALGVVCAHPHYPPGDFDLRNPCRYFIRSPAFARGFSGVSEQQAFAIIQSYSKWTKRGPLGQAEVPLADDNGDRHIFLFESFNNGYDTLTLAIHQGMRPAFVSIAG